MKWVNRQGKTEKSMQWVCPNPNCKNDVFCSLVFVEGGYPVPPNLPIYCPSCYAFVALVNPILVGVAGVGDAPPAAETFVPLDALEGDDDDEESTVAADIERIESDPDQGETPEGRPITGTPPPADPPADLEGVPRDVRPVPPAGA